MSASEPRRVAFRIDESAQVPVLGLLLGSGAMVPFVLGAAAAWTGPEQASAVRLTIVWGGAVLAFLAGVRRGLSFRTPGGERPAQLGTMLALFVLALAALVVPWPVVSVILLMVGYGVIAVADPIAARRREVPLFFARLRPVQMVVPVACLGAVLVCILFRTG